MNKDQARGYFEEAKGKVKEFTGKLLGNKELEFKGKVQTVSGRAEVGLGNIKAAIKKPI